MKSELKSEAIVLFKSRPKENNSLVKASGERTLVEIIEDTRSGVPAKSELESKVFITYLTNSFLQEKKAFLNKRKRELKREGKELDIALSESSPSIFKDKSKPKSIMS